MDTFQTRAEYLRGEGIRETGHYKGIDMFNYNSETGDETQSDEQPEPNEQPEPIVEVVHAASEIEELRSFVSNLASDNSWKLGGGGFAKFKKGNRAVLDGAKALIKKFGI